MVVNKSSFSCWLQLQVWSCEKKIELDQTIFQKVISRFKLII